MNERETILKSVNDLILAINRNDDGRAQLAAGVLVGNLLCDIRRIAAASERQAAALERLGIIKVGDITTQAPDEQDDADALERQAMQLYRDSYNHDKLPSFGTHPATWATLTEHAKNYWRKAAINQLGDSA